MSYPYSQADHDECAAVGGIALIGLLIVMAIMLMTLVAFSVHEPSTDEDPMDGSTAGANAHVFEEVTHEGEPRD